MTLITLSELTHTGTIIDANNTPLAIGYIAAHLESVVEKDVEIQLFKYPKDLSEFLGNRTPQIAAFSNYMWNERLQYEYASQIKKRHPHVVTIFGGPNYPIDKEEQLEFLRKHPNIDFYVDGEGELAFAELVTALIAQNSMETLLKRTEAKFRRCTIF